MLKQYNKYRLYVNTLCITSSRLSLLFSVTKNFIFLTLQVNIMVLTRVVIITISTGKRRSLMMADSSSPIEQVSEQIRWSPRSFLQSVSSTFSVFY